MKVTLSFLLTEQVLISHYMCGALITAFAFIKICIDFSAEALGPVTVCKNS
jgi:hypothetical protein